MTWLLVAIGAAVGAPLRYLTDRAIQSRHTTAFPWGTFTVNVTGCAILGAVAGAAVSTELYALLGTGLCGALTTYSTFSYETFRLAGTARWRVALANATASVLAGTAALILAFELAT
ncbi:fluoride efflux transporter CrcB [Streptomyces sp. NPDC006798]|uniref:fluoride efflux transporter CrcB n=1 Tax=Streptomyces sp. NPDC006798 TaxID=3155462 RepID=UPI00340983C4